MVNDHLTPCFPVFSLLKLHVQLLQRALAHTRAHTHAHTAFGLLLSGSDFSLRISQQIWIAGCRFFAREL